jgi:hypothetical protein
MQEGVGRKEVSEKSGISTAVDVLLQKILYLACKNQNCPRCGFLVNLLTD